MGHRGRLQVKPEKKQRGSGTVPVSIKDEWTDAGKVRVFLFSDGTKTRVPWKETESFDELGVNPWVRKYEAPSFQDALDRRAFPPESVARRNEELAPLWLRGARGMACGAVVFAAGLGLLGVKLLVNGLDAASFLAELVRS